MTAAERPPADTPREHSLEEAEAAYERFVWDNLRRNYAGHYLHGMLGMTGFRLFNAPTIFPVYLHQLGGGSPLIVGIGLALQQLGGVISPLFGASQIEHRKRVLPVAAWIGTGMRIQILGIALAGWFLPMPYKLWAIVAFMFLFGVFQGTQGVAFQTLLAKVIPISRRGRLQAWRNVTGGLVAAALSLVAGAYIIQPNLFGNGYSTTFLLAFVLTSLGLTALTVLMVEPEPPTVRERMPMRQRLKDLPALITSDRSFKYFMLAQLLASAGAFAVPFYILMAGNHLGYHDQIPGAVIGLLTFATLGADTATNLIWGYLGDKFGFRVTFIGSLIVWAIATAALLFSFSLVAVFLCFFAIGAAQSGQMMSSSTMVLEFGNRDDMPMRLALTQTAQGSIRALGPIAGGAVATAIGYTALFAVSIVFLLSALATLIFLVEEPRNRRLAA